MEVIVLYFWVWDCNAPILDLHRICNISQGVMWWRCCFVSNKNLPIIFLRWPPTFPQNSIEGATKFLKDNLIYKVPKLTLEERRHLVDYFIIRPISPFYYLLYQKIKRKQTDLTLRSWEVRMLKQFPGTLELI